MNKEEITKLVFETLSKIAGFKIKPNKEFYVVGNGVKDVYKIDENSNLYCKTPEGYFRPSGYTILPVFNGVFQLEEIKEPLLTSEENASRRNKMEEQVKQLQAELEAVKKDRDNIILEHNKTFIRSRLKNIFYDYRKTELVQELIDDYSYDLVVMCMVELFLKEEKDGA